jgi:hypothetical protein
VALQPRDRSRSERFHFLTCQNFRGEKIRVPKQNKKHGSSDKKLAKKAFLGQKLARCDWLAFPLGRKAAFGNFDIQQK